MDFGDQQRGRGVGERILDDGHHNESRGEKLDEADAADIGAKFAHRERENREEEQAVNDGADEGLEEDFEEPPDFFEVEGPQADPVDAGEIARNALFCGDSICSDIRNDIALIALIVWRIWSAGGFMRVSMGILYHFSVDIC